MVLGSLVRRARRLFLAAAAGFALAGGAAAQTKLAAAVGAGVRTVLEPTTIDFESLTVPKPKQGSRALVLSSQFAGDDVTFANACAADLSAAGTARRAHSGVKVAVRCRPPRRQFLAAVPSLPLVLKFAKPVQNLSLWVMPIEARQTAGAVMLIARDSKGAIIARTAVNAQQGLKPGHWMRLDVRPNSAAIASADLSTSAAAAPFAIDDVAFLRPVPALVRMGHANDPWTGPVRPVSFVRTIAPVPIAVAVAALTPIPLPGSVAIPPPPPTPQTAPARTNPVQPQPKPDWWPWLAGALGLLLAALAGTHWYRSSRAAHLRARVRSRVVSRSDPVPVSTDEGTRPAVAIGIALVAAAGIDAPGTKITITPDEDDDGRT